MAAKKQQAYLDLLMSVQLRGGKFIDDEYLGANNKHTFECMYNHRWKARC